MIKDYRQLMLLSKRGLSIRQIARMAGCKWETARDALERMKAAYGSLEAIPQEATSDDIRGMIRSMQETQDGGYLPVDCDEVLEKRRHGMPMDKLWAVYAEDAERLGKAAYRRSRFCEIVADYASGKGIAVSMEKVPGIKCEVDWVGDRAHIIDVDTGELIPVHIFVMALPYSSYFYCEGFFDERMGSWLAGHKHGFEFFGGVPVVLVPDNCKTAVTEGRRSFYEEVVLNRKYSDFADYYGIAVRPARIRHPKDKSVCERSVRIIEDDIMPEMERLDIYSLDEFNSILRKKLIRRLARPFTKRYGSRSSIFEEEEKKTLLPLPVAGYRSYTEREAAVGRDGYIQYSCAFYSVPPQYIKRKVIAKDYEGRLYIYDDHRTLIAEHPIASRKWQRVTDPGHQKHDLALYGGYSKTEFDNAARSIGSGMYRWVQEVKGRWECEADSYRTLLGVFSWIKRFPADIAEAAAQQALHSGIFSVRGFKAIVSRCIADEDKTEREKQSLNSIYIAHKGDGNGYEG